MVSNAPVAVSVVLSTYNRAAMLRGALDALVTQAGSVPFEVILVDNNSTDCTATLVRDYTERYPDRIRYVFEGRQGLSYGRNAGILAARGAIVALTDDDVQVAPDWIQALKRAFETHPVVAYVGGRILPRWTQPPPRWLTTAHWSPLALQDYGDAPMEVSAAWPICLVGASLAFRRETFDRIGLFTPSFGRIKDGIGSTEDHEMQLRLWTAGLAGVYVPDLVSLAEIPPERMMKRYHRRWHHGHGRHCARMRLRDVIPRDWAPMRHPDDLVTLFGTPAFVYAEVPKMMERWIVAVCRRRDSFFYGNKLRHLLSYIAESWRRNRRETTDSAIRQLARFAASYPRKASRRFARASSR
jgi:glycosyltransferase involved in cell wall biosynthesis